MTPTTPSAEALAALKAIEEMHRYFVSGNVVQVEKAMIPASEWRDLRALVVKALASSGQAAPNNEALAAQRILKRLEDRAREMNSAYDYYGMGNTSRSVDPDAFDLATAALTRATTS